mmetsp:Transcript_21364/g.29081  ORF Transcript_21364/g.29081 Transcript_21364/m.29081 type:complete len:318 (-) Transcript_21364:637-1590(-)
MEQQQVSIAKSGVVASLSARCSVTAAANPAGGHYDTGRTISENLKMSAPLLSRFDLIFILLDKPEERHDHRLSRHVLGSHPQDHTISSADGIWSDGTDQQASGNAWGPPESHHAMNGVSSRIRNARHKYDVIHPDLLRKYVRYAREYIHPRLSGAAATVLQRLYLKIREESNRGTAIPITTRQLESLVRLSQARARAELRDVVTEQDAREVVEIMEESLLDSFTNESGQIDLQRRGGMSLAKQAKSFIAELNKVADVRSSALFSTDNLKEIATRMQLPISDFLGFLDLLNDQAFLLKKGSRLWQLQTHGLSQVQRKR